MKQLLITIAAVVLVGCGNPSGELIQAAIEGNIVSIRMCLSKGADVNAKDEAGYTPLHHAAERGYKVIVKLLITKGADVNARDHFAKLIRDGVVSLKLNGVVMNANNEEGFTPLYKAIDGNHTEIIKHLINNGADVNVENPLGGRSPLHMAVDQGKREIIEMLVNKGADVNAREFDDRTPLDLAIAFKHTEIAELLRKHGAKTAEELKAEGK